MHDRIEAGDRIGIGGPRNNFRLDVGAALHLRRRRDRHHPDPAPWSPGRRPMGSSGSSLYGGRSRPRWPTSTSSRRTGTGCRPWPHEERGLLDLDRCPGDAHGTRVYCCGPEPLLDAITATGARLPRWGPSCRAVRRSGAPAPGAETAFEVELASSGTVVTVRPDEAIVDALFKRGCARADLLPPRNLRHLRDRCRRRRAGPSGLAAVRGRTAAERVDVRLRLSLLQ